MQKLKKKNINNLLNYQPFLKNNDLKNKKFKLKNILFENHILYNNLTLEAYVIEFNNHENIYLPFTLIKIDKISTVAIKHENIILFNYDLTSHILYQFNKIMFQTILKKQNLIKNSIKGRILGTNWNYKKIFISCLGYIFSMKPIKLNNALNYKKRFNFNKYNTKGFYKKRVNAPRVINCYKLKYLNFKINTKKSLKTTKKEFSRVTYIKKVIQQQKIKNNNF